jgi:hypothetical protein
MAVSSSRSLRIVGIILAIALVASFWTWWRSSALEFYRQFESPDKSYRVVVLRRPSLLPMFPGQASDAPGEARLIDRNDRVLAKAPVEMVQLVEDVDWSQGRARIKFVADWDIAALSARP